MSRRSLSRLALHSGIGIGTVNRLTLQPQWTIADVPDADRALGAFIHGAPSDPAAIDKFADLIDRRPAIVLWFEAWGSSAAVTGETVRLDLLHAIAERGAIPMITWEPWDPAAGIDQPGYRLALIARGDFDAYINAWAYRLAAYEGPVWMRFAHEMNAPWYPWGIGVNDNSAEDFVAAWKHVRERFLAVGATNVQWIWCVDATTIDTHPVAAGYPGDDEVDWVALDGYNWGTSLPSTAWRSVTDIFGAAYGQLADLTDRPMIIAEMASTELGGSKADWIREGFAAIPDRFPRVKAACWFNEWSDVSDWRVQSSPESLAAFSVAVSQPAWQGYPTLDGESLS